MNTILPERERKKHKQSRETGPTGDKGSTKASTPPAPASRAPEPASHSRQAPGEEPAIAAQPERRSLLKGLFGFLGNHQDNNFEQAETGDEFTAPEPAGWTVQEKRMLANIAELHGARVADIMIPRADIEALELNKSLGEALQLFEQSGHSRLPVYAETLDDPRGMIHIRDLLNYITRVGFGRAEADKGEADSDKNFAALNLNMPISRLDIIRDVLFVPASQPAGRLLARMQASRTQMALVIDEHGGTDGLVSMEDIVELIVGDIEDEHDEAEADIVKEGQNSWIIDAAAELEELQDKLGMDFADNALAQEVDTLGGLIVTALDRIPARGEKVEIMPDYIFQILDADRRRIKRIRLIRCGPQAETPPSHS
ncbi:hemolysin family protein [Candidatus Tokpelaia sp.]|uniref:hemolysin family protein n=1 Tax=Candidatus Tokpelaia sp. TaxID=2233777 RepID=UPI001238BE0D|nr:hemolysin family protein [Candidatus Tokpelaia sp.]KAA6405149.1 HlyC/CorC family transporter [Candidatus Tokpelaia sp.]